MGHRGDWPLSRQDLAPAGEAPKPGPAAAPRPPEKRGAFTGCRGARCRPSIPSTRGHRPGDRKSAGQKARARDENARRDARTKSAADGCPRGIGYIIGLVGVAAYFKRKPG